ncbi:MAG TPA: DNA primase [Fimbriimonas sp.]|nr:DNA primase [Fimbriimonas sp.]
MADERDEIRARIDIVDLVSQRVSLKRSGKNYTGLCPFHDDRNPSFYVDPTMGRYRCWSCGESGDIFDWVMKTENVDFAEALQSLAQRAGVTLRARSNATPPSLREMYRTAMAEALQFFREQLASHSLATDYCSQRGLDGATIEEWEIGYAPNVGEALATHLKRKGIPLAEAKGLFLVDEDASGGYYDRFRSRLMFPIRDEKGELVAFGGRLLGDGHPKYINSSDTPLYRKSRVLYGMNKARDHLSKARTAVLTEGYLDVIACHRSGVKGAVASLGTALGEEHAKLLKRWCDQVTVLYDSDAAGQKAAERAIDVLQAEGLRVRIALMPSGEDPDTLLKTSGPEAVSKAASKGVTPIDFRLSRLEERLSHEDEAFWDEAVAILGASTQHLEVDRHISRLAGVYPGYRDISAAQRSLSQRIDSVRRKGSPQGQRPVSRAAPEHRAVQAALLSHELVIFRALYETSFQSFVWIAVVGQQEIFATQPAIELAQAIAKAFPSEPPTGPPSGWIHRIEPESMRVLLTDIAQDLRASNVLEDTLIDAIGFLRKQAEQRKIREERQGERSQAERQEILNRLRRLNVEEPSEPKDDEEDPFA